MDETQLALMRPPAHNMLWNEGEFLFSHGPAGTAPDCGMLDDESVLRLLRRRQDLEQVWANEV